MSNYYSSGYGDQQPGNDGFYSSNAAGGYTTGQQSQQRKQQAPQPPPQQAFHQQNQQYGAGNMQQWTQPQTQSTQQQQQPAQQSSSTPSFWNPAAAATVMSMAGTGLTNDKMLDLASSAGKSFFESGSARMIPGLETAMTKLRVYFAVDNRYVKRKMQKVLFPFLSKHWKRQPNDVTGGDSQGYALPNSDENAPDLYLPFMSLITYVLLCALCYGNAGQFSPEVIPDVTTKCLVTQLLEVLAIRFGFYMMQAPVAFLDLFCYTGYKYLGLVVNMLVGVALTHLDLGTRGFYITGIWTASAASYFMLKTMANNIPVVTASTGPKREVMVVAFAASQFATMWFVSQTKFLK